MELLWWMRSPSPFSIIFYTILIVYALRKLFKDLVILRKRDYLSVFTDALLLVGFSVVFLDTYWVLACLLRFGWFFPDSVMQLIFSFTRNIIGLIFCYMLTSNYFVEGKIRGSKLTVWVLSVNILFLTLWFLLSPSPAWTDWTYAIRHNYPLHVVLSSFFISHVIGKSLVAVFFISIWKPQSKLKQR